MFSLNQEEIQEAAIDFFKNHLKAESTSTTEYREMTSLIPRLVTDADHDMLLQEFSEEEGLATVKAIPEDSAPRLDYFTSYIFIHVRSIVAGDVVVAVREFFMGKIMKDVLGASINALVSKLDDPKTFQDYRPTSLCQVFYKIITKVVANRLVLILPKLISMNQGGFITGRLISENVALAQELVHNLISVLEVPM